MKQNKKKKLKEVSRILLYIRGFSIFFVLATHVAISMLAAEVNIGNEDILSFRVGGVWQLPSMWKFLILEIGRWPVPVFIFLAGYSLVRSPRSWKVIGNNCKKLILPLVLWSLIGWLVSWRNGSNGWSVAEFLVMFFSGRAQLGYYFILLILQFYILSMFLIPLIERRPILILVGAAALQLFTHTYDYFYLFGNLDIFPTAQWIMNIGFFPEYLFPRFILSFTLGIWISQNVNQFKMVTEKNINLIVVLSIVSILAVMAEVGLIFDYSYNELNLSMFDSSARAWGEWKISTAVWTIISIYTVVSVFRRRQPLKKIFELLGKNSYQIFLLHGIIMNFLILFCYKIFHNIHWYGIVGYCAVLALTITISMFSIKFIQKRFPNRLRILMLGN